jgi:CRISPR-associated endonuclease/helicase Cas3
MSLSRKGVVKKLHAQGVPEGWKESSLLRNCFALLLGAEGRWALDAKVRLDEDLGLVYESTEAE